MRNWLQKGRAGRNGSDALAQLWSLLGCAAVLVSLAFGRGSVGRLLFCLLGLAALCVCYFRVFSRRVENRRQENQRYLHWRQGVAATLRQKKARWQQRRQYRFYRCPQCRTMVRVPRGRGRIEITCPRCGGHFRRRS